jgi:hypothetical protein
VFVITLAGLDERHVAAAALSRDAVEGDQWPGAA